MSGAAWADGKSVRRRGPKRDHAYFGDRENAPLPRERLVDMPFVFDGRDCIICPWPRGPLHFLDEARLLTVLALVDRIQPSEVVWMWSDPTRAPEPVRAERIDLWVEWWQEGRVSYVTRKRAA